MAAEEDLWEETSNSRQYQAYLSRDKVLALEIIRASAPSRCPGYGYLLDISWGRRHYSAFSLFFTFMVVTVTGENLKEVVDSIKFRKCAVIQEFRAADFDPPASGKPVIRKIEIIVKSIPDMIADGENNRDRD
jgi:hypothetical protein